MSAINKRQIGNDDVYEATADVTGGQLVIASGSATNAGVQGIAPAGAKAANVLGVAARDAIAVANQTVSGGTIDGFNATNPDQPNELTAVWKGCVVPVTYTAAAVAFGVKLVTAASGQVQAYTAGTDDASKIVGECREVGGVGSGGGVGLALIY